MNEHDGVVGDAGEVICDDANVRTINKGYDRLETIGLSLDEGKASLGGVAPAQIGKQLVNGFGEALLAKPKLAFGDEYVPTF